MSAVRMFAFLGVACLLAGTSQALHAEEKKLTTEEAIARAMDCNIFEKQMAEKAVDKASDEDVKKFARMLVKDHEKLSKDLEELAKDKKLAVVSGVTREQKEQMADLAKASGKDFDKKYIDLMVDNHARAVKHLARCVKETKDDELRSIGEKAIPVLRKHLKEARALQKKLATETDKN